MALTTVPQQKPPRESYAADEREAHIHNKDKLIQTFL